MAGLDEALQFVGLVSRQSAPLIADSKVVHSGLVALGEIKRQ